MAFYHCPFCPFGDDDSNFLMQHVGLVHPETDDSPFLVKDEPEKQRKSVECQQEGAAPKGASSGDGYIECECGETVLLSEFSSHSDLHLAEGMALEEAEKTDLNSDTTIISRDQSPHSDACSLVPDHLDARPSTNGHLSAASPSSPKRQSSPQKHPYSIKDWANVLLGTGSPPRPKSGKERRKHKDAQRLGKADLGPHAFEDQMPTWLRKQLERGAKVDVLSTINSDGRLVRMEQIANETRGLLPVISQLCEQDRSLSKVYLCHPDAQHVVKMEKEGGFCGYRNIQMLVSYIQDARAQGHEHFPGRIPSILQLQDLIERAWDLGFNSGGRIETGGIRGTRKFIGTPEAQALFQSLDMGCEAHAFNINENDKNKSEDRPAFKGMYEMVEDYFQRGITDPSKKVCKTSLPPLYFQHPGENPS